MVSTLSNLLASAIILGGLLLRFTSVPSGLVSEDFLDAVGTVIFLAGLGLLIFLYGFFFQRLFQGLVERLTRRLDLAGESLRTEAADEQP